MINLKVHKASPLGKEEAPSVTLTIGEAMKDGFTTSLEEAEEHFVAEAQTTRTALRSLPQGTRYQLLLLMLQDAPVFYRGR